MLYIPVGLDIEIKSMLKRSRIEEFSREMAISIPVDFDAEVHYYLYGEDGRVQNFLFDRYVLIEHSAGGRMKHEVINRNIPDYVSRMIRDKKLVAHLHSHPNKSCITRLESQGINPSFFVKRLHDTGHGLCQPSLQCFSDRDLKSRAVDMLGFEIGDKTRFVEVLYCEPDGKYVGYCPHDKITAEIIIY